MALQVGEEKCDKSDTSIYRTGDNLPVGPSGSQCQPFYARQIYEQRLVLLMNWRRAFEEGNLLSRIVAHRPVILRGYRPL